MFPGFEPGALSAQNEIAVVIWNQMGAQIDWKGLEVLVELHAVQDVEGLVYALLALRGAVSKG